MSGFNLASAFYTAATKQRQGSTGMAAQAPFQQGRWPDNEDKAMIPSATCSTLKYMVPTD